MKIWVIIPDGVGLRNFAFRRFSDLAESKGIELVYVNFTDFDLNKLGFRQIRRPCNNVSGWTDLLKAAWIRARLMLQIKRFNDSVYQKYIFPSNSTRFKTITKNVLIKLLARIFSFNEGLEFLEWAIHLTVRRSEGYHSMRDLLIRERPDIIFCTNQRPIRVLSLTLAAQDLRIPTGVFIFSWDNIPKCTLVVRGDCYLVWSNHMARELRKYHPEITENQIAVSGSPQFEMHGCREGRTDRTSFFRQHGLDSTRRYICYSGDDVTTSPFDQDYLRDLALAVEDLNKEGHHLGVLFRPCPVDHSQRYDAVLERFRHIMVRLKPLWEQAGESWDSVMPLPEDTALLLDTILHTELVVNVGSSMVFDFALFDKPCIYMDYIQHGREGSGWRSAKVYGLVHFRSMPTENVVFWAKDPIHLKEIILEALSEKANEVVGNARKWFNAIHAYEPEKASERILQLLEKLRRI